MPTHHFKSKESYRKYEAYKHIHHIKTKHPRAKIYIAGHLQKPKQSRR